MSATPEGKETKTKKALDPDRHIEEWQQGANAFVPGASATSPLKWKARCLGQSKSRANLFCAGVA
ncbi:hypothetical protein [Polaromonas jejuensis]|uniref:Uncharacterized protein n=1 Tax=Polaromonas jejuensis TaxID=457502 RepID=A0ABW0Q3M4_9BURK|nr:hypothetical protein [Polaromonas jejuensis]